MLEHNEDGNDQLDLVKPEATPSSDGGPQFKTEVDDLDDAQKRLNLEQQRKFPWIAILLCAGWTLFVAAVVLMAGFHFKGFALAANALAALIASVPLSVLISILLRKR